MAILDDFEVDVLIDGEPADEFDDDDVDEEFEAKYPNSVSRYVEAVSGAFFAFRVRIKSSYVAKDEDSFNIDIYVDGKRIGTPTIGITKRKGATRGKIIKDSEDVTSSMFERRDGKLVERTMQFSNIELRGGRGDDNATAIKKQCEDLGIFQVEMSRAVVQRRWMEPTGSYDPSECQAKKLGPVPENALKGSELDVATCYAPASKAQKYRRMADTMKLDDSPMAVFRFKYRTRRALQTLGIVPTPVPLEDKPLEDLSRDEMLQLLLRQREQSQVKQEDRNASIIKRERQGSPKKPMPHKFSKGPRGEKVYHLDSDSETDLLPKSEPVQW